MNVLIIIPSYYPAFIYGGPIFSTYHVCTELSKLNDVDVRVSTTNSNMTSRLDVETNKWLHLNEFKVKYYNETIIDKLSFSLFLNVWKDIKKSDIVHIQSIFNSPTPVALFYSVLFDKKIVLSPRGSLGNWCLNNGSKYKKAWLKYFIAPFSNKVIWHATAQQEKQEILTLFPTAKVAIIPNGIAYEDFQDSTSLSKHDFMKRFANTNCDVDKIVISMGRLQEKKGFDILIKSFSSILSEYPTARLLIAGQDEGERSSLVELIKTLELSEHVFLIGPISGKDKVDFLANADLFALPSHNENFGNVYVESLAAGTPVVASTNTPWSEVVEAECGLWVPNTIEDTSSAIFTLLKQDRETIRTNSKQHAKKYYWNNIAQQFKDLFNRMGDSDEK